MENKSFEIEKEQLPLRIKLLAGQLIKRHIEICPDKSREKAICPNCQTCAYEPEINFIDWSIDYLIDNEIIMFDDDYSLGEINYRTINDFFQNRINE